MKCRRCANIDKALLIAQSIETFLNENPDQFQVFYNSEHSTATIRLDDLIATIAKLKPLPTILLPKYFERSTKRNIYPIAMTNAMRMLCSTFKWTFSDKPASLDIAFNQTQVQANPSNKKTQCKCSVESIYFTVVRGKTCPLCNGISPFVPTASRISDVIPSSTLPTTSNENNNTGQSHTVENSSRVLRDITNSLRPPLCLAARPNNAELSLITRTNNMLSNFVVSYFFKILQANFPNILYQEFLFDFVKREGGWSQFVQFSRQEGHSINFLEQLRNCQSTCIVPICQSLHWTLLVRKYVGQSWIIYYIDSILQGSEDRMNQWSAIFNDNDLFSGTWIKLKIIPQTELECGARVCLLGLCFALSMLNAKQTGRQLERVQDLAARSRLLVSRICTDGNWSHQGWLNSIIGTPQPIITG
eukprot:CAMPEP_0172428312 /NCGR_PEP_ID=MMETSP1064-20121228/45813_1 /TAXON_ID=202472 /ORGANISM="Aulacoseira subarctica , Strain CCAP 1002/5" /LENGTH=416 /DNA_ID=CAMNT_0013173021 /DNA_START=1443 /DNA_END=2689 /DNA_ORIENTATION=-